MHTQSGVLYFFLCHFSPALPLLFSSLPPNFPRISLSPSISLSLSSLSLLSHLLFSLCKENLSLLSYENVEESNFFAIESFTCSFPSCSSSFLVCCCCCCSWRRREEDSQSTQQHLVSQEIKRSFEFMFLSKSSWYVFFFSSNAHQTIEKVRKIYRYCFFALV